MRSLLKYAAFGLCATAIAAVSFVFSRAGDEYATAGVFNSMAIDLDPSTAGVQNILFPAVGSTFHVRVSLQVLGQGSYNGYRARLTYDDAILDAGPPGLPGALPADWSSAPGATTGGNVLVFTNSASCLPATGADALQDNGVATDHIEDDTGTNAISMSCVDSLGASVPAAPPHDWVDFYLRCATAGDTIVRLDIDGTHPLPSVLINSSWNNAFIYCTGSPEATPTGTPTSTDTPTNTPTATNTPEPTSTPTATNTSVPTSTPTATNTSVPTSTPTATPTTPGGCFGDLNGDGRVTGRDISIVARSIHNDNPAGDVDHDGDVDLVDLKLVIAAMHAQAC